MHRFDTHPIHATCVAWPRLRFGVLPRRPSGILLLGPSGSGKSDLALRLIDRGWQLVADDQVTLRRRGSDLIATGPGPLCGKLEVRGLGIVTQPTRKHAKLQLAVTLAPGVQTERLPDPVRRFEQDGIDLPMIELDPFHASSPAKIEAALAHFGPESHMVRRPSGLARTVFSWR